MMRQHYNYLLRKVAAIALAILCLPIFTSCSSKPSSSDVYDEAYEGENRELTIGVIGMSNMENYAAKFIKETNPTFNVKIIDYTSDNTTEAAIAKLNAELTAGKGPDIIDFDTVMDRDIYARQGLLRDMSDFFYDEFQLDDFYTLDFLNSTGPLYFFSSNFGISTAYGNSAIFGDMSSWSFADYERLSSLPQFADTQADTQQSFMEKADMLMIPHWLNLQQGTCNFDDGSFADALSIAGKLSSTENSSDLSAAERISNGSLLYTPAWIESPFNIRSIECSVGAPVSYIGVPTPDGSNGTYMVMFALTGVNANTENADLAWEFIHYLLVDDELIYSKIWNGIPVLKSAVQQKIDYMLNPYAEFEGKNIVINEDGTFEVDGVHQDMTYDPTPYITEEQAETFYALIDQAQGVYEFDTPAYKIMMEVADRYFAGQYTLDEAVEQVQSRVSLYLAEQYA